VNAGTVQTKNSDCYVGQFEGDGKTRLGKVVKEDTVDRLISGRWDSQTDGWE